MKNKLVSIIIPIYNEEKSILECLQSLKQQAYKPIEIILVDDGSNDKTQKIIRDFKSENAHLGLKVLSQSHKGPGIARNLGSKQSTGVILVFVDADMTFDKNFILDLVRPILTDECIGTFSKNEMVKNANNIWSVAWNINRNCSRNRMLPTDYPDNAPVFRAILKNKFEKVGGFDTTGEYTDDWSLSRKLKTKSRLAKGAIYYHSNPDSLAEVWKQARWIGKNEFVCGNLLRKIKSLLFYCLPFSLTIGTYKTIASASLFFLYFKIVYDFAVWLSVIKSFIGEPKTK